MFSAVFEVRERVFSRNGRLFATSYGALNYGCEIAQAG
jgi:hypothetical protein